MQDDNAPINTAGTVQLWFDEHEGELPHLPWPAQTPDLNITAGTFKAATTSKQNQKSPRATHITKITTGNYKRKENCITVSSRILDHNNLYT
jgi:hypothetical protein